MTGVQTCALPISIQAGAAINLSPRTITIDKVDGQAVTTRVYNQTEKGTVFAWQANVGLPVAKLGKRLNLCLEGGYGFNGGSFGVRMTTSKVVVERIVKTK